MAQDNSLITVLVAGDIPSLDTAKITTGTFADARIAASNVTQHEAALTILESQITDGTFLARVGSAETITQPWTYSASNPLSLTVGSTTTGILLDSVGEKRIAWNDGGGNLLIRSGGYFNVGEKYVKAGDGAVKMQFTSDAQSGVFQVQVAGTGVLADDPITYGTGFIIDTTSARIGGSRILTVADEGTGNGLDADTVDGSHASAFSLASHTHTLADITDDGALAALNTVGTAQIDNNAVTLAKVADIATARIMGRVTAATGDPEALTGTQATTLLDNFTSTLKGLAPLSGGGTTNFLRADGTWAAPPGGTEVNDLSSIVTWANVPDVNITQSSVTQHEAALTILESQITDSTILARVAGTETITGTWTLDGVVTGSDFGTGGKVKDGTDVARPIGFNIMPVYEIDVNDTFDLAHNGMLWHKDLNAAVTFTCANDATIPQGATYGVHNDDTEDLTIAQGTGVTINFLASGAAPVAGNVIVKQGGIATVYKYTDTEFWVWGDVAPLIAGVALTLTAGTMDVDISGLTNTDISATAATDSVLMNDAGVMKQMDIQDMGLRVVNSSAIQTFALGDATTLQVLTGTITRVWTIPTNASVAFNIGAIIYLAARDTAAITVTASAGVTLTSINGSAAARSDTVTAGGMAALVKVLADEWMITGDI